MNEVTTTIPDWTIGVDLGDQSSEVCVLDADGEVEKRLRIATTSQAAQRAFASLPKARVVLEAGTHSPWLSRLLQALGTRSSSPTRGRCRSSARA